MLSRLVDQPRQGVLVIANICRIIIFNIIIF